eukprot:6455122-Pyramimonas_sp.AAC.1
MITAYRVVGVHAVRHVRRHAEGVLHHALHYPLALPADPVGGHAHAPHGLEHQRRPPPLRRVRPHLLVVEECAHPAVGVVRNRLRVCRRLYQRLFGANKSGKVRQSGPV